MLQRIVTVQLLLLTCLFLLAQPGHAQGEDPRLDLSLESRWRLEGLINQFRGGLSGNDQLLALRTLVQARYSPSKRVSFNLELADSRGYLDDAGSPLSTSFINSADILQANVELDLSDWVAGDGYVRVGRFTRDIGGRRFIARNGFRNTINAFTGLDSRLELGNDRTLSAFAAVPIRRQPRSFGRLRSNSQSFDREDDDLLFWGVHLEQPVSVLGARAELMLFGLFENDDTNSRSQNRRLITPAVRLLRAPAPGIIDFELEAAFQTGQARATLDSDDRRDLTVAGTFLHAEVGLTLGADWTWRLAAQIEHASGESRPDNGTFGRYDTLFGVRRRDFNNTSIHGPLGRNNIEAVGMRFSFRAPMRRLDGRVHWLANRLASRTDPSRALDLSDPAGASGRFIGHTVDSRLRYWLVPGKIRFEIGASVFFKGRFARTAPGAPDEGDSLYGYTQLTLTL